MPILSLLGVKEGVCPQLPALSCDNAFSLSARLSSPSLSPSLLLVLPHKYRNKPQQVPPVLWFMSFTFSTALLFALRPSLPPPPPFPVPPPIVHCFSIAIYPSGVSPQVQEQAAAHAVIPVLHELHVLPCLAAIRPCVGLPRLHHVHREEGGT